MEEVKEIMWKCEREMWVNFKWIRTREEKFQISKKRGSHVMTEVDARCWDVKWNAELSNYLIKKWSLSRVEEAS